MEALPFGRTRGFKPRVRYNLIRLEPESTGEKQVDIESVDHMTVREALLLVHVPETLLMGEVEIALEPTEPYWQQH